MKTLGGLKGVLLLLFLLSAGLVSAQSKRPVKVACIGNSITQGVGVKNQFQDSYPGILAQWLGKGYDVRNFGYSGRTLLLHGDRPYMKEKMYQDAQDFEPDIVTIKLGTNDTKTINWPEHGGEFEHDLRSMVSTFQALASHPKIYLCYPVPPTKVQWTINDSTIVQQIIPIINRVAADLGTEVIDLHTPLLPHPENFPDCVHPNEEGAWRIASVLYRTLTGQEPKLYTPQRFAGKQGTWKGFEQYTFYYHGKQAIVVAPAAEKVAEGRPWIWRPAFFGAFATVDSALVEKGFHVVYYDLTHQYGSPKAMQAANEFYRVMTKYYKLSKKVTLEGFSRGGYCVLNWASQNPSKVACIYVDAPVCNIESWPSRKETKLWGDFLQEWGLSEEEMSNFHGNPIEHTDSIALHQIPVVAVCGLADQVVPFKENFQVWQKRFEKQGGRVFLITKKKCDHHPHSLTDPTPVVDFILKANATEPQKPARSSRLRLK
jgi:lysophospholipase L1-like esterase